LHSDDTLAQADTAKSGSSALAERTNEAAATGVEGGSNATHKTSGYASEEGEGEQAKAEGAAQGVGREIARQECDEYADRKRSYRRAKYTACHCK
jgi:hypothetical protein